MDKWTTSDQKFNKMYIIQSEGKYDSKIPEESRYETVLSPSGFINRKLNNMLSQFDHSSEITYNCIQIIDFEY